MWSIITDLQGQGETVILTTHYMEEAEELCNRVDIMDRVRIIALNTPSALIAGDELESRIELRGVDDELRASLGKVDLPMKMLESGIN